MILLRRVLVPALLTTLLFSTYVDATACDADFTALNGTFNGPLVASTNKYPDDADCTYTFAAPSYPRRITFIFSVFAVENDANCAYDYLKFTNSEKLCGSKTQFTHTTTMTGPYRAIFKSDGSVSEAGFRSSYTIGPAPICTSRGDQCGVHGYCNTTSSEYTCTCLDGYTGQLCNTQPVCAINGTECGVEGDCSSASGQHRCVCKHGHAGEFCDIPACNLTLSAARGTFRSPSSPEGNTYPDSMYCTYTFTAPSYPRTLSVNFSVFYMEEDSQCLYDYLELPTGNRTCGNQTELSYELRMTGPLILKLVSDDSVGKDGVQATYSIGDYEGGPITTSTYSPPSTTPRRFTTTPWRFTTTPRLFTTTQPQYSTTPRRFTTTPHGYSATAYTSSTGGTLPPSTSPEIHSSASTSGLTPTGSAVSYGSSSGQAHSTSPTMALSQLPVTVATSQVQITDSMTVTADSTIDPSSTKVPGSQTPYLATNTATATVTPSATVTASSSSYTTSSAEVSKSTGTKVDHEFTTTAPICTETGSECGDHGKCDTTSAPWSCECFGGYGGRVCENEPMCTADLKCENDGYCNTTVTPYTCECPPAFGGIRCADFDSAGHRHRTSWRMLAMLSAVLWILWLG